MKLGGYFYAKFIDKIFDPEEGAEKRGSTEGFPVSWEGFVRNVRYLDTRRGDALLEMETLDGEQLRVWGMGAFQRLENDGTDGDGRFVWTTTTSYNFDRASVFQDCDSGGAELMRPRTGWTVSGYLLASRARDDNGREAPATLPIIGNQSTSGTFIEKLRILSAANHHLLAFTTVAGEKVKVPISEPFPQVFYDGFEGGDDSGSGKSGWYPAEAFEMSRFGEDFFQLRFALSSGGYLETEWFSEHDWQPVWGTNWRSGSDLFAGYDFPLTTRALHHVFQNKCLRAAGLPLKKGSIRFEALLAPATRTSRLRCVGIDLWIEVDDRLGLGGSNEVLLARRDKGRWTNGYCQPLLNACLEAGVSEPHQIDGLIRLPIDLDRAETFVSLFDRDSFYPAHSEIDWREWDYRVDALSLAVVEMFHDSSNRTISREELPDSMRELTQKILDELPADPESVLDNPASTSATAHAKKVLEGVLDVGLIARLDSFIQAFQEILAIFDGQMKPLDRYAAAHAEWVRVEDAIRNSLLDLPATALQDALNVQVLSATHMLSNEEGATFRFTFDSTQVSLEFELDDTPRPADSDSVANFSRLDENDPEGDYWRIRNHWEALDHTSLNKMGFRELMPWHFVREQDHRLSETLSSRLIVETLREAAELSPEKLWIFVDDDSGNRQTFWFGSEVSSGQEVKEFENRAKQGSIMHANYPRHDDIGNSELDEQWGLLTKIIFDHLSDDAVDEEAIGAVLAPEHTEDGKTGYSIRFKGQSIQVALDLIWEWEWKEPFTSSDEAWMAHGEEQYVESLRREKIEAFDSKRLTQLGFAEIGVGCFERRQKSPLTPALKSRLAVAVLRHVLSVSPQSEIYLGGVEDFADGNARIAWSKGKPVLA